MVEDELVRLFSGDKLLGITFVILYVILDFFLYMIALSMLFFKGLSRLLAWTLLLPCSSPIGELERVDLQSVRYPTGSSLEW